MFVVVLLKVLESWACKKNFRRSQTGVLSAALGTPTCVHRGLVGLGSRVAPRISSA
jgi:hypothetical protein